MNKKFPYKKALVTGASSGIGREIARLLCKAGVQVVAVGRNRDELEESKHGLSAAESTNFHSLVADLLKPDQLTQIITHATDIDLLVNVAGVGYSKPFEQYSKQEVATVLDTNLYAPIALLHGILKNHAANKSLSVVFTTSLAGKIGFPNLSIYSASKFALEGLCESLRIEYKDTPIHFAILRPGVTDTNFFKRAGMDSFYESVKGTRQLYSSQKVASEFMRALASQESVVTVGRDKYFLKLLPFIPFSKRFKVLDVISNL